MLGLGFYLFSFKLSGIKFYASYKMTRDAIGPAAGLNVCAAWYPENPKASSSGDYLVPQKKK